MKNIIIIILCCITINVNAQKNKVQVKKHQTSQEEKTKTSKLVIANKQPVTITPQLQQPTIPKYKATDIRALMDTSTGPVIINFWASWCGPCVREIPWFDSLIDKSGRHVKLVLVSLDFKEDYPKRLIPFLSKKPYKDRIVYLDETNANYFIPLIDKRWSGALPSSIFLNNSKKYYEVFNYQLTVKRFELELNKLPD